MKQLQRILNGCKQFVDPALGCTPGLRADQWMMEVDRKARLLNQGRLHALSVQHSKDVRLFCSHDAIELKAFADGSRSS
ncbi:hypothetical protein QUA82_34210 [Microcoleus sp. F8-D3]